MGLISVPGKAQKSSNWYGSKYYKRISCLKKWVNSNVHENRIDHNVGCNKTLLTNIFKRMLSVKKEGTEGDSITLIVT
jgi:hypothetical protein